MNTNARKWLAALRSGEFKQGRKHLRDEGHYCCLGVACEVFLRETGCGNVSGIFGYEVDGASSTIDLPPAVADWLGLTSRDGWMAGAPHWLTEANDVKGWDFERIADLIESEPKGLFVRMTPPLERQQRRGT